MTMQHLKRLVVPRAEGGRGLALAEIGGLTLDQVQLLLTAEGDLGGRRAVGLHEAAAVASAEDGTLRARAEDGTEIRLRAAPGKSVASMLAEKEKNDGEGCGTGERVRDGAGRHVEPRGGHRERAVGG
jgi:hypothetical protein